MKDLYLHIGQPRTGTTSIQHYCSHNTSDLATADIHYAYYGRDVYPFTHKLLWYATLMRLGGRLKDHALSQKIPPFDEALEAVRQEILASSKGTIVISFEGFTAAGIYPQPEEALTALKEKLDDICRIYVVYFCRDPLELIVSNYKQRCKASPFTGPFLDFVMSLPNATLNQNSVKNIYENVFGKDNILTRLFPERKDFDPVTCFLESIGCSTEIPHVPPQNKGLASENIERSRLRAVLDGSPHSHRKKLIFGASQPSKVRWQEFVERLEMANQENQRLFRESFKLDASKIGVEDIFWRERIFNHSEKTDYCVKKWF